MRSPASVARLMVGQPVCCWINSALRPKSGVGTARDEQPRAGNLRRKPVLFLQHVEVPLGHVRRNAKLRVKRPDENRKSDQKPNGRAPENARGLS